MKTFGMKLREERKKRGMKQADLAEMLGISLRMIGDYENGKRRPHRAKMKEYAEKLDLPYEYLLDDRYETVLSVFNGVTDDTPADVKYRILSEETAGSDEAEAVSPLSENPSKSGQSDSLVVPPRAQQEMDFIQAHAHALFAGAEVPQEAKDKFFEALYDSYLACRAKAIESGIDVNRIDAQNAADTTDSDS
ncbi:MAG: helix-turn-helix domain-containing protein [Ruminococcus sp.]|nr:helix-turn-helix domain-containing protein [Ruminococcus sp.]